MDGRDPAMEPIRRDGLLTTPRFGLPSVLRRGVVWMVAVLGVGGGALLLWQTLGGGLPSAFPHPGIVAIAAAAYGMGMVFYSHAWAVLLSDPQAVPPLRLRFLVSQPAKYVPGGFAQPLGQVLVSADVSRSRVRPSVAFPVHAASNVVSAGLLVTPLAFWSGVPGWVRVLAGFGPIAVAFLYRPLLLSIIRVAGLLLRRQVNPASLPSQVVILRSLPFAVLAHGLMALAFGFVASGSIDVPIPILACVYMAAWVVGYVAVPFPAGVGAREVTLVFLMSGIAASGLVLAVTVIHRLLTVIVELLLMAGSMLRLGAFRTARYEQ